MTVDFFNSQMDRLSGLRFPPGDLTTHWEALRDLPQDALYAAVSHAQKTRVEFPTPVELRRDADLVRVRIELPEEDRSVPLETPVAWTATLAGQPMKMPVVDREWRYYCDACHDTGRESVWCGSSPPRQPWLPVGRCENRKCERIRHGSPDYGHEWVRPCPCADMNPELRRRREREAQYAAVPQGRNR